MAIVLGIRSAIVLSGLGTEGLSLKECAVIDEAPDRLTIVTAEMAALAEELKTGGDNRRRREEIA